MNKSRNKRNNRNRQNRRKTTRGGGRYWFRKETPQEMEKEWVEKNCEQVLGKDADIARYNQVKSKYLETEKKNRSCCVPNLLFKKKQVMQKYQNEKDKIKENMDAWMEEWDTKMSNVKKELKELRTSVKKDSLSQHGGAYTDAEKKYFNDLNNKEGINCSGKLNYCDYIIDPIIKKMKEQNDDAIKTLNAQHSDIKETGNQQIAKAQLDVNNLKKQLGGAQDMPSNDLLGTLNDGRYELKNGPTKVTLAPPKITKDIKKCKEIAKRLNKQTPYMTDDETYLMNKANKYKLDFNEYYMRDSIAGDYNADSYDASPYGDGESDRGSIRLSNSLSKRDSIRLSKSLSKRNSKRDSNSLSKRNSKRDSNSLSKRNSKRDSNSLSKRNSKRDSNKSIPSGFEESKENEPEPPKKKGWRL